MSVILVAGAIGGMGRETARAFAGAGAHVLLGRRDRRRRKEAADDIAGTTGNSNVTVLSVDLASLAAVRDAAQLVCTRFGALDVLVNNGAAPLQAREVTDDGFERHWQSNVLGPHLLATLLPALSTSGKGRVVEASTVAAGGLHVADTQDERRRFNGTGAHRASKQAVRMLAWSWPRGRPVRGSR